MTHYEKLTSEKYLTASVEDEIRQAREAQNEKAIEAFTTMTCALSVFAITLFSALNFPEWTEIVRSWF